MSEARQEPLSWLMLERYALDELAPDVRVHVAARLAESSEDRACLASILNDVSELVPLPSVGVASPPQASAAAGAKRRVWAWTSGALALAAALTLMFARSDEVPPSHRRVFAGVKGGEVALVVHGEHTGEHAASFAQGERFKVLVSCPSWLSTELSVVVFQAGQRYEPLPSVPLFACGNLVPWPGAFSLDGSQPADVCVSFGAVRQRDVARSARELEPSVVCQRILPR